MPKQARTAGKNRTASRIPTFKSIEQAAEFWDTHDTAEFEDEFEDVEDELHFIVTRTLERKALTVRLPADLHETFVQYARDQGVSASRLAMLWVAQRLWNEGKRWTGDRG